MDGAALAVAWRLGCCAALLGLAACASDAPSTGVTEQAVLSGAEDTSTTGVVAVVNAQELCTGYLIMPDLVLTARHCAGAVTNPKGGCGGADGGGSPSLGGKTFSASSITVFGEAVASATAKPKSVAEVMTLPDSEGAPLCGNDLALLRLAEPLADVTPLGLRLDMAPAQDEPFTAVGYGEKVPGSGDSDRRRSGQGAVESIGASSQSVEGEWTATTGPCAGDSGSPALDADGNSFGVMSHGSKSTCQHMVYERVDVHADWLREQAQASATRLGVDAPGWAATEAGDAGADAGPAPSDSSSGCTLASPPSGRGDLGALVLLVGALAVTRRRRRS